RHTRSKRDWSSDVCSSDLSPADGRLRATPLAEFTNFSIGDWRFFPTPFNKFEVIFLVESFKSDTEVPKSPIATNNGSVLLNLPRSEERRVGKECMSRTWMR